MSLPWWGLGDAAGWAVYVALAFTFAWMASLLQPLLSGHGPKVNCVVGPDPRLARGPLVEVPQREFGFDRGGRVIRVLIITTIGCALGAVVWIAVGEPVGPAITIPSASFAVAFWTSELSSRGIRFRVDEKGVHARFLLRGTSIRWSEIGEIVTATMRIATRYNVVTWKYFCILGGGRQIGFPERMVGADELAGIVAAATGMSWHDAANEADQSRSEPRIGE